MWCDSPVHAVKFLSDLEELNVSIVEEDGQSPGASAWVTNAARDRFLSIFTAGFEDGSHQPLVLAVPSGGEILRSAIRVCIFARVNTAAPNLFNHM